MIIEKQNTVDRLVVGDVQGFEMSISTEDMAWLMTMIGDLYKDPYAILPQEYLSNAWDSHLEAGVDKPIVMSLKKDSTGKWVCAFKDWGVGISPERVKIYGRYGKSTRRGDKNSIGGFGIGCKSFNAYTKILYIDTVYDNMRYKYMISPNEEGIPRIDLIFTEACKEENQTSVWFYLKETVRQKRYYSTREDTEQMKFVKGAKRKTSYFDNLVYDFDESLPDLNEHKRIEGKHFVYSTAQPYDELHILIGQVPYTLSWELLGINRINTPIAVKVEGIMPTPTREDIKYTSKSITIIKDAIKDAANELVGIINKRRKNSLDWKDWIDETSRYVDIRYNGSTLFHLLNLEKYSDTPLISPEIKGLEGLDIKYITTDNLFPFKNTHLISNGIKRDASRYSNSYAKRVMNYGSSSKADCVSLSTRLNSKKHTYLHSIGRSKVYVFKNKLDDVTLEEYEILLNLKDVDKPKWKDHIDKYKKFVNEIWESIPKYEDIEVPKEILEKEKTSSVDRSQKVYYKLERRDKFHSSFRAIGRVQRTSEFNHKKLVIYSEKDESVYLLDKIWTHTKSQNVEVIYVAKSNLKYLEGKHQYVHVKNWKKTKMFKRVVTAYKAQRLLVKYAHILYNHTYEDLDNTTYAGVMKDLSSDFKDLLSEVYLYTKTNFPMRDYHTSNKSFMKSCMEIADESKLWDYEVYHKIEALEKYLEVFSDMFVFKNDENSIKKWKPMYVNYIKKIDKSIRLDAKWYQN